MTECVGNSLNLELYEARKSTSQLPGKLSKMDEDIFLLFQ